MSTVVKDLGAATAYGYAVEKGYTGTEAEFAELMASYVTVGQTAVNAAQTATTKASEAATSAIIATNKASEATTAAQTASTKASEAVGCVETATQKATEATQSASQALGYKNDAESAKADAESARDAVQSSAAQIATNASDITALKEDLPKNFFAEKSVYEQLEYVVAEGLYVDSVNKKAVSATYDSYGFKIPKAGSYYFSSPGDFVSEEMTEAGQVFTTHQAITEGTNTVPCAGYYYKYNATSIYAYKTKDLNYEDVLKRGNIFSFVMNSANVRYTQGSEVQATTIQALVDDLYVGNYGSVYKIKSFAVSKGKTYIFKCDSYSVSFDVPLMMFVKYAKSAIFSTRTYGYPFPYRANKTKSFEIPFYANEDGFVYVQTNNGDSLTIKCYEVSNLESVPKQYPQYNKMLTIGDSLTSNGVWQPVVRENLFIPQSSTVAVAGKCISNNGDDPIYDAVMALTADSNVDLITLWAGTNDFAANVTLGTLSEQIDTGTRDNTTFYGGVLDCVEHLITIYPNKRIIMIGTTPRTWNNGASNYQTTPNNSGKYLADYVDAFHDVAKYYGIPFLDLLRTSGINVLNIDQYMSQQGSGNNTYYLHPTNAGYKYIGGLISAFIKSVG